jgi:hypothetical protein
MHLFCVFSRKCWSLRVFHHGISDCTDNRATDCICVLCGGVTPVSHSRIHVASVDCLQSQVWCRFIKAEGILVPNIPLTTPRLFGNCVCCSQHVALSSCSRCGTVTYCSKECQRKHWCTHRRSCIGAYTRSVVPRSDLPRAETAAEILLKDMYEKLRLLELGSNQLWADMGNPILGNMTFQEFAQLPMNELQPFTDALQAFAVRHLHSRLCNSAPPLFSGELQSFCDLSAATREKLRNDLRALDVKMLFDRLRAADASLFACTDLPKISDVDHLMRLSDDKFQRYCAVLDAYELRVLHTSLITAPISLYAGNLEAFCALPPVERERLRAILRASQLQRLFDRLHDADASLFAWADLPPIGDKTDFVQLPDVSVLQYRDALLAFELYGLVGNVPVADHNQSHSSASHDSPTEVRIFAFSHAVRIFFFLV